MIKLNKLKLKAFSLIEVLIMLTVISFTMISAMSVIAKANVSIKNNEKLDVINTLMFKSIELLKSPSQVYLTADGFGRLATTSTDQYFALVDAGNASYLIYNTNPSPEVIGDCADRSNPYYYAVSIGGGSDQSYNLCLQIRIKKISISPTKFYYVIQTIAKYDVNGTATTDTLITYRYDSFLIRP